MRKSYPLLSLSLLLCSALHGNSYDNPSYQKVMYYEVDPKTGKIVNKEAPSGESGSTVMPKLPDESEQTVTQEQPADVADNKLAADVRQAILNDSALQAVAKNISVIVSGGNVTVVGIVNNQSESDRVQTVVKGVPGVKSVTGKIFVNRPGQ